MGPWESHVCPWGLIFLLCHGVIIAAAQGTVQKKSPLSATSQGLTARLPCPAVVPRAWGPWGAGAAFPLFRCPQSSEAVHELNPVLFE